MGHASAKVESKGKVHPMKTEQNLAKPVQARALSPLEEMEQMMERFFGRSWLQPWRMEWPDWSRLPAPFEGRMPKIDIVDRDKEILVHAELPGVDKKDLDVTMTDTTVTIKGKSRKEEKEEKGDYYRCEISQGSFARTVTLPAEVDTDKAKASFKDGMLELTLPKVNVSKRRNVKIE